MLDAGYWILGAGFWMLEATGVQHGIYPLSQTGLSE